VVVGLGSDNLTKIIMEALMIGGGLPRNQIAQKLICFGVDSVNVFQGIRIGVTNRSMIVMLPIVWEIHCMAHRTNLEV
jgi:hypothetical protein